MASQDVLWAPRHTHLASMIVHVEVTIGRRILEERRRQGWEQAELAQRLSTPVGQQTVSRWERGASRPRRAVVVELAALFGIEATDLLTAAGYTALTDHPGEVQKPVRPHLTVLPVSELAPDTFEELVADVARELRPDTFVSRFGSQGHKQYGVDMVAEQDSRYVQTYQCKRHKEFGPQDVKDAVAQVTIDADAHVLVLARRSASPEARREMQSHPGWSLWDAEDISRIVRGLPLHRSVRLVDNYFPGWRAAFLGVAEPGPWLQPQELFQSLSTGALYNHDWTLFGRRDELDRLVAFASDPDQRLFLVVGRGGIGKTKLLREACRTVSGQGTQVFFLKQGSDVRPEDFELLPAQELALIVIDDAHDQDDLTVIVGDILRRSPLTKIVLSLRPLGIDSLRSQLRPLGIPVSELPRSDLTDLSRDDAKALAAEALGPEWPRQLAEGVGYLTADCPFVTVVAGVLIRRGLLDPACVDHADVVRQEVLNTFYDVVVADPVSGDREMRRDVLDGVAALQPFRSADPAFQCSLSALIGGPYDRAARHIRSLEDAGVLLRRGRALRVIPDLLGDVIMSRRCFDDASGAPTGYLKRAWEAAQGEAAQHLFVNASRMDWQVRHDHPGAPRLTDCLWDAVDEAAHGSGILGRMSILKLLQKVAYFEPQRSMALVEWLVENPTDTVENVDDPVPRLHPPTYEDVLHGVPAVVRAAAFDVAHLRDAANLLWRLAAIDRRETDKYPEHPLRVLRSLAEFDRGKPLAYNHVMIDVAADWLAAGPGSDRAPSPFDVLEPLLATEGSEESTDGVAIRFRPYLLDPTAVRPLRERVVDLALEELASADIRRASRAVKVIEASLRFPVGMFGRPVSDDERKAWLPNLLQVLARSREAVATTAMDPVIIVALRRAIHWHLDYSQMGTRDAARDVMARVPGSLQARAALALFDGWCDLLGDRRTDVREMERNKQAQLAALAEEITTARSDEEIVALLEERLAAQRVAFSGQAGTPGPFVAALVDCRPQLAVALCAAVAAEPRAEAREVVAVAISRLADLMPDAAMGAIRALLATGDLLIKRSVAHALSRYRGARSLLDGEFEVLFQLAGDEDPVSRTFAVAAAQRLSQHHSADALALLSHVRFTDSAAVAEEVFQSFSSAGALRWSQLPDPDAQAMLAQLVECSSVDGYWVQDFLVQLSKDDPVGLVTFLMRRVHHCERMESALEYRPLPFQWRTSLQVAASQDFVVILRAIRDWMAQKPDSWKRQDEGGSLFAAVAGNFDDPDVVAFLDETLAAPDANGIAALASILRHMPRDIFLSGAELAQRVLAAASSVGAEHVDRVMGAMYGAVASGLYTGTPGQPLRRDVEQRERARHLAQGLTPGSLEERFYRSLARSAEEQMQWRADHDDKLLDGREW